MRNEDEIRAELARMKDHVREHRAAGRHAEAAYAAAMAVILAWVLRESSAATHSVKIK